MWHCLGRCFTQLPRKQIVSISHSMVTLELWDFTKNLCFPCHKRKWTYCLKNMDSGARWPGFQSTPWKLQAVWSWTKHGTLLCLSLFICKMGTMSLHVFYKTVTRITCVYRHKAYGEHHVCQLHRGSTSGAFKEISILGFHPQRFCFNCSEVCVVWTSELFKSPQVIPMCTSRTSSISAY